MAENYENEKSSPRRRPIRKQFLSSTLAAMSQDDAVIPPRGTPLSGEFSWNVNDIRQGTLKYFNYNKTSLTHAECSERLVHWTINHMLREERTDMLRLCPGIIDFAATVGTPENRKLRTAVSSSRAHLKTLQRLLKEQHAIIGVLRLARPRMRTMTSVLLGVYLFASNKNKRQVVFDQFMGTCMSWDDIKPILQLSATIMPSLVGQGRAVALGIDNLTFMELKYTTAKGVGNRAINTLTSVEYEATYPRAGIPVFADPDCWVEYVPWIEQMFFPQEEKQKFLQLNLMYLLKKQEAGTPLGFLDTLYVCDATPFHVRKQIMVGDFKLSPVDLGTKCNLGNPLDLARILNQMKAEYSDQRGRATVFITFDEQGIETGMKLESSACLR